MNICFVYKYYPIDNNYDSGIGKYLYNLVNSLKAKNNITILTTSNKPRTIRSRNLTIYAIKYPKSSKRSISFLLYLLKVAITLPPIISQNNIQLIEFANWECEGLLFSKLVNIFLKTPIVIRLHTPSSIDHDFLGRPKYFSEKLKEFCEKIFVNQINNYLTTSTKFNERMCRNVYGLTNNKHIEIIPLGIKSKKVSGHEQRIKNNILNVLYVGRLEKRKGFDMLVKAIPKVLYNVKNVRFIIVGRENGNEKWVSKLRNSIPYECLENVSFLGYIDNTNVMDKIYKSADICVAPSRYESFGITIIDAMSYGKVIVACKAGGIPEIITNHKNGILIKSGNSKELSDSICLLCKDDKLRNSLGANAKDTIKREFSSENLANKSIKYYQSLILG